jgi:hypothetical protein
MTQQSKEISINAKFAKKDLGQTSASRSMRAAGAHEELRPFSRLGRSPLSEYSLVRHASRASSTRLPEEVPGN